MKFQNPQEKWKMALIYIFLINWEVLQKKILGVSFKLSHWVVWALNFHDTFWFLIDTGGTPASLSNTGEQWDSPNAWPPLQSIIVQGLYNTNAEPALAAAKELASRWLRANYLGYEEYGEMFEKVTHSAPFNEKYIKGVKKRKWIPEKRTIFRRIIRFFQGVNEVLLMLIFFVK